MTTKRKKFGTFMKEGPKIFGDGASRPRDLPLVAFFDHPWVKRHHD